MSDTGAIADAAVERIAGRYGLQEREVSPLRSTTTGAPLGEWRTLIGPDLDKAVVADLTLDDGDAPDQIHLFHALCRPATLAPHLMVEWSGSTDSGGAIESVGVVVDLIPRLDLGVNLAYVDEVYRPLSDVLDGGLDIDDVVTSRVPPRRATAMSPWAFAVRAPATRVSELAGVVDAYIDHWIAVVSGGVGSSVDPLASDPSKLVQHDRYQRETLFHEESDPLWPRLYRTLGPNDAAELRMALRTQETR